MPNHTQKFLLALCGTLTLTLAAIAPTQPAISPAQARISASTATVSATSWPEPVWKDTVHPVRIRRHDKAPLMSRTARKVMVTPRFRISYPAEAVFTERFTVTITPRNLKGESPRAVYGWFDLMETLRPGKWDMENTRAAGPARSITLNVSPSDEMDTRKFRFLLDRRDARTIKSPIFRVEMVAPATPQGSPDDWSSLSGTNSDGSVVRWNPCQPIRWVFNPNGTEVAYPDALVDVSEAVALVSARTGLTFTYVGPTTAVPYADNTILPTSDAADLYIGFASSAQVTGFTETVVGLGGPLTYTQAADGSNWIDQGAAMLRTDSRLGHGFTEGGDPTYGQTMIHEILHAMGLGHARGDEQIMSAYLGRTNHLFGAGDLTGMSVHGASHGCPISAMPANP